MNQSPLEFEVGEMGRSPENLSAMSLDGVRAISWFNEGQLKLARGTDRSGEHENVAENVIFAKLGGGALQPYLVWAQQTPDGVMWSKRNLLTGDQTHSATLYSSGPVISQSELRIRDDFIEVATIHKTTDADSGELELWLTRLCKEPAPVSMEPGPNDGTGGAGGDDGMVVTAPCDTDRVREQIANEPNMANLLYDCTFNFNTRCFSRATGIPDPDEREAAFLMCIRTCIQDALRLPDDCADCFQTQADCSARFCPTRPAKTTEQAATGVESSNVETHLKNALAFLLVFEQLH